MTMIPKLQLALDTTSMEKAKSIALELKDYWDVLEIGTSLLISKGLDCVTEFRNLFKEAIILVDTKIIDRGDQITKASCRAGGDIVTVVSAASENTIKNCVEAAERSNCKVFLDHISDNWLSEELIEKSKLGVDFIGLHLPKDVQSDNSIKRNDVELILQKINLPIAIAGGIKPETLTKFIGSPIHIFVIGGYLMNAENRIQNGEELRSCQNKFI